MFHGGAGLFPPSHTPLGAAGLAGYRQLALAAAMPGRKPIQHLMLKIGADTVVFFSFADGVHDAAFPAGTAECAILVRIRIGTGCYR